MCSGADDFRPSLRRAEDFLRRLKAEHPQLQLIALTATANETVREALRLSIFGLRPGETRDGFAFITANPLRPELAIYRRTLAQRHGGAVSVAGLVERVVEAIDGHAIFYCLTVRQVETLYAHLSDFLQGRVEVFVLRYHGRLTDAEKTGVASHFKSAPRKGEDGYRRMIVVATSAFGLGIDRPDIRCVFCVSPPTDLAALYQQLGRAGRDRAAHYGRPGPYTAALALSYPRAQRTISFMTQRRLDDDLYARIAGLLLKQLDVFSARQLAQDLIDEDLRVGKVSPDQAVKEETLDTYKTGVQRVFAELSRQQLADDLGDFPRTIEVRPGDYQPDTDGYTELVEAVVALLPADQKVETLTLYARLWERFPEDCGDPGALWATLLELHTLGYLDVSQRPNREQLTAVHFNSRQLPEPLVKGLSRRHAQVQAEVARLREWFTPPGVCCNEGLREYFAADALPPGTCEHDDNRCIWHWNQAGLSSDAVEPKLYEAFSSPKLRPTSATTRGRRYSEEQLDRLVGQLLWHNYAGLVENIVWAVLRGEDHYFSRTHGRRRPLWPKLLLSRIHGRKPALRKDELRASIGRLVAKGEVTQVGATRYRLTRYIHQDVARIPGSGTASGPALVAGSVVGAT